MAHAEWQLALNRMGFMGEISLGAIYDWNNPHSIELSFGTYHLGKKDRYQSNFAYRYSLWKVERHEKIWVPIQIGIFTVRTWDLDHYFLTDPDQYPYSNYYDQTAFRWGIEFGSVIIYPQHSMSLAYYLRILDTGLIAIYNNAHKDLQYFSSSGLSIRYHF